MSNFKQYQLSTKPEAPSENIVEQGGQTFLKTGEFQSPNFKTGEKGWKVNSEGKAEFVSATLSKVDIGGEDASSFHVDVDGNFWLGASVYASAPFKVSNTGELVATSVTNLSGVLASKDNTGSIAKSADTQRDIDNASYTKIKEFAIKVAGDYDIIFTINNSNATNTTLGRIYKNGIGVGTERTAASAADDTYNETISGLVNGDLLQFYGKTTKTGAPWGYVKNFRLRAVLIPDATVNTD